MSISEMEPMLPADGDIELEDLAFDLITKATALKHQMQQNIIIAIGDLVRSMNCYYSNLIEDHYTHPIDIYQKINCLEN